LANLLYAEKYIDKASRPVEERELAAHKIAFTSQRNEALHTEVETSEQQSVVSNCFCEGSTANLLTGFAALKDDKGLHISGE
jgi:hypothetical protein